MAKACCTSCSVGKPCCASKDHDHVQKSEGNPNHDPSTGQFASHEDISDHLPENLRGRGWKIQAHGPDDDGTVAIHVHHPFAGKVGHLNGTISGNRLKLFDTQIAHPVHRGKGVGRAMFNAMYQHAAEHGATSVDVPEHSTDASRVLQKLHGEAYKPQERPDAGSRVGAYDYRYQPTSFPLSVKKSLDPSDPSRFFDVFEVTQAKELRFKKSSGRKIIRQLTFQGLPISIETDRGQVRDWFDPASGERGKTKMNYPYGYIRRTEGADGDEIDVYIGPEEQSNSVFIVHQRKKPNFTQYDEDKVMLGFSSPREAKAAYLEHFDDRRFFGTMTETTMADFKRIFMEATKKAIGDERPDHEYIKREGEPGHYKYTYPGHEAADSAASPQQEIEQKLKTTVTLSSDTPEAHSALKAVSKAVAGLAEVMELDPINGLNGVKIGVTKNYDAGGVIHAVYDFDDRTIAVDDSHPETFNHEFGHFLDHMIGGHGKNFFTEQNRGSGWLDAVRATKSVDLWRTHWRKSRPEFGQYYNKGTEIFARYFDQWVHTKLTEKGLNPEDYHSDFMRLTQEDADKYADFGEPESNEPLIGAKGMFSKADFEKLRPAFEAIIQPYLKKALETFMQKNMDPGLVGAPPPPPMPMAPMGMMPPMMGMGPPPTDVETFEGVTALLGRIGTVPDQALMEIASTIWGNGYQFQGQQPDQARQEIIGFLLDQRDLLGIAPEEPSLQPSPSLPDMAPSGSSDYFAVSRASPVTSTVPPQGVNSSGAAGPDPSLMNWFEQDLSRRSA